MGETGLIVPALAVLVPFGFFVLLVAVEYIGSRGTASEQERTEHRLREHHGFHDDALD